MRGIKSQAKRNLRAWLEAKYFGRCCYCTRPIGHAGTVDHYVPTALGGTNARQNLRWACRPCNQLKADLPPDEWDLITPIWQPTESAYERKVRLLQSATPRRQKP